ncbi:hypothetical protein Taro_008788 [Colocasia esculenta]|uniref:Uncharacterized protein n=1 Tax=Colocasia esculenta TaxID=4460 RepID=A0A843U4J3_COLES|nr:hypothetical protein [Colocasia esculenta]
MKGSARERCDNPRTGDWVAKFGDFLTGARKCQPFDSKPHRSGPSITSLWRLSLSSSKNAIFAPVALQGRLDGGVDGAEFPIDRGSSSGGAQENGQIGLLFVSPHCNSPPCQGFQGSSFFVVRARRVRFWFRVWRT